MDWLGLTSDNEIIFQHKNQKRHIEIANTLLNNGLAYRDWEQKEDFEKLDISHAIRFKTPKKGETIIDDKIQGEVKFKNKEIEDFVLLRSDGTPTYMSVSYTHLTLPTICSV